MLFLKDDIPPRGQQDNKPTSAGAGPKIISTYKRLGPEIVLINPVIVLISCIMVVIIIIIAKDYDLYLYFIICIIIIIIYICNS